MEANQANLQYETMLRTLDGTRQVLRLAGRYDDDGRGQVVHGFADPHGNHRERVDDQFPVRSRVQHAGTVESALLEWGVGGQFAAGVSSGAVRSTPDHARHVPGRIPGRVDHSAR
uniref:(northern house mosquito) hypothetical protein n=1 Tax=Culex pipiens TaxID=7175 RepID=A0A8D8AP62_CULPI